MSRPITSLTGFVKKIETLTEGSSSPPLYRGQRKKSYNSRPSVFRALKAKENEHLMIKRLLAEHPHEFNDDASTFDSLVRAQHYGLPTRLLDMTNNPHVALYFATKYTKNESSGSKGENGRVFIVTPDINSRKDFDSDTVSCIANLCFLTLKEKERILDAIKHPISSKAKTKTEFNEHDEVQKLVQYVQKEKPYFEKRIVSEDLMHTFSVVPRKLHPRIIAQDGAFLLFGLMIPLDLQGNLRGFKIETIDIDWKKKEKIRKLLNLIGISEATLFPEIDKSAEQIKIRYT